MRIYSVGMVKCGMIMPWSQSFLFVRNQIHHPDGDRILYLRRCEVGERCPISSTGSPAPQGPLGNKELVILSAKLKRKLFLDGFCLIV